MTGRRRTLAGEGDPCPCAKRACIRAREERDAALEVAAAAAAQLHELQAELAARAAQVGAGEGEQLGAAALQQAALTALDGREECVVRLRLSPAGLASGSLWLNMVVFDPDEDTLQDQEEAEESDEQQPAPQLAAAPVAAPVAEPAAAPATAPRNAFSALMSSGGSLQASMARRQASTAAAPAAAEVAPAAAPPIRLTARVATGRALRAALEIACPCVCVCWSDMFTATATCP